MMQRDTTDLSAQNKELKMKLEAFEQQAQLREGMCIISYLLMREKSLI